MAHRRSAPPSSYAELHAQAQWEAAQARAEAAQLRVEAAQVRQDKRLQADTRSAQVSAMNDDLTERMHDLETVLPHGLARRPGISFEQLKKPVNRPDTSYLRLQSPEPPPDPATFLPAAPTGMSKLFGKGKYEQSLAAGRTAHLEAVSRHAERERVRYAAFLQEQTAHTAALAAAEANAEAQHAEIDAFEAGYRTGNADQVRVYNELVLTASPYPEYIIQTFKTAYMPDSRQLVIEYELPTVDVLPAVKAYRYVRASDTITETARPTTHIKSQYASVVAQLTLRTLWEIFTADTGSHIDVIVFNGVVNTIHPGSGQPIRPCLITVRTTRDLFSQLDLTHVEPLACLKFLSAGVSKSPTELVPVRPVLEFSMIDPRFVDESDALSLLDERPNLLQLTPTEFEILIQNLFTKMGLEAKQTRASRDGGVDCVAYDTRPILGGKVVIQAKRYKNTVGVSAVRDLFGTLQNEGASKGILVTTSGYGQASFQFASNKPIELIDGANLLYLLKTHADIDAKIEPPEDWQDPQPDATWGLGTT